MGIHMKGSQYHLLLRNGQQWILKADPKLEDWLQHLSRILMLREAEPGNDSPCWKFCLSDTGQQGYDGDGWVTSHSRWMSNHVRTDGTDLISEIIPYERRDPKEDIVRMMLAIQTLYLAVWPYGGIPVHAALLERNGEAIMIAAPGGTGKSTCADRIPLPWHAMCDDSVLLIPAEGRYYAHPLPTWSDFLMRDINEKVLDIGHAVPVTDIWFLEHGEKDRAIPVGKGEAASRLYQSAVQVSTVCLRKEYNKTLYPGWHKDLFHRCCDAVSYLSCGILQATINGTFWDCL